MNIIEVKSFLVKDTAYRNIKIYSKFVETS